MTLYIDFVRVYRTRCSLWGSNPLGPSTAYERFLSDFSYSVLWKPHNPRLDSTILLKTVQCIASTSRRTYLVVGSLHPNLYHYGVAGAPSRIRTDDLHITSVLLWPAELSGHKGGKFYLENLPKNLVMMLVFFSFFFLGG